jgi:hypothetical protein
MSLIDTLPRYDYAPTAAELKQARDILRRKALFDVTLRQDADHRGDYATAQAYRQRIAQLDSACDLISDCLAGILPGV